MIDKLDTNVKNNNSQDFKTPTLLTALECCNRRNIKSEWIDLYSKCKSESAFDEALVCLQKSDQY